MYHGSRLTHEILFINLFFEMIFIAISRLFEQLGNSLYLKLEINFNFCRVIFI